MLFLSIFGLYFDQVLAKLEKFKKALSEKNTPTTGGSEDVNNEDLSDWRSVNLKFTPESGKVSSLFYIFFHF